MSERILKALMQLFAIISDVEGVNKNGKEIVKNFLKQQLNSELVKDYLELYNKFIEEQRGEKDITKKRKRTSLNSVKVLKICTQINEELTQKQKIIVLLRLLEYILSTGEASEQEKEFVETVAETFNINKDEYEQCFNFVQTSNINSLIDNPNILIISNGTIEKNKSCKHISIPELQSQISILKIKSVNIFALKLFGNEELYLNGQHLTPGNIHILTQGSTIRSKKAQSIYYSDVISCFLSDTHKEKIVFTADSIEYKFKNGKIGLHPLKFSIESGKLMGIMGASGAGKSTLLNVLNGINKPSKGKVIINGINIHNEPEKIEGTIGYVSQDDLLIEELTVFQNLFYNAKLCFGKLSDIQITKRVLKTLDDLGLYEIKDLKVGGPLDKTISGGQRKRLNIALELIREPTVLFVDEPTSGLSSRDSENIMDLLKELSLKGKLVITVIHQPSSEIYKMFDELLILDQGGYPIYFGNPLDAIIYFKTIVNHVNSQESECITCGNVNPEQIFNIIEAKVVDEYGNLTKHRKITPKEWYKHYKEKIENKIKSISTYNSIPKSTFKVPGLLKQFKVFITRDVLSKLANTQYLIINFLEAPALAFILSYLVKYYNTDVSNKIGYIFRENENIPAYLFMCVVVAIFLGLMVSAEEIIKDRKILKREAFLNLSRLSYLGSKITIMFVLSAIQMLLYIIVGNSILEIKGMWWQYWLILFSTACFANMLGLNISASFNSAVTIYILIPFLIIPQLLLSGVIVKFDKLNPTITAQNKVPLAGEIMASRWAFEALAVTQFKDNKFEKNFYYNDKIKNIADFKKNFWIPKINEKIATCLNKIKNPQSIKDELLLLKNELSTPNITGKTFKYIDSLNPEKVNKKILLEARKYTNSLFKYYLKLYLKANEEKDKIISKMNATPEKREEFLKLKNSYENESLSDLLRNKNEINKIVEINHHLYQQADPVFLDPSGFRAHFYAPSKKIFGFNVDTLWANLIVLWLMSITLMITLYYDVLRKFLKLLNRMFLSIKK